MERLGDRQFPNIFLNNFNRMIFLDINYYSEKKKNPTIPDSETESDFDYIVQYFLKPRRRK